MDKRLLSTVQTYLIGALLAGVASAGCYSPSLQPCEIACANRECPDGLVCNTQGVCALTDTATCDQLPIDAPNGDGDTDGGVSRVTIEVRDRVGTPLASAFVVFADASGAQIAEMPTGADGLAMADMLPGGSATVIRTIQRASGGSDLDVATYLDLWPDAHVISQAEPDQRTQNVAVDFSPPAGTGFFIVSTSCSGAVGSPNRPINIIVPLRCSTFDVIVTASLDQSQAPSHAAVLMAQTSTSISIPVTAFKTTRGVAGTLSSLPSDASTRAYSTVRWASPGLPSPASPPPVFTVAGSGLIGVPFAMGAGVIVQLRATLTNQGVQSQQVVFDRFPASALSLNRNYDGDFVQWIGDPIFDLASRRLAWPFIVPVGVVPGSPTFFTALVRYSRGAMSGVNWRLIGPASRIQTAGSGQLIVYPDIPGMRMFEPEMATDTVTYDGVTLFQVEPLAAHDVIQILEPAGPDMDFFKIPALKHITVSVSGSTSP